MASPTLQLLRTRRLLPLFMTQFMGALNDNFFKNALVILILFKIADTAEGQKLVTLAAGLFILPFFLFSATAGQLADRFEKGGLIRLIKIAEIAIMGLAAVGFHFGWLNGLLVVLFLMGVQSAFFGPLKYAILPDHLKQHELVAGNGLIEAGTFLAILIGTIAGGLLVEPAGENRIIAGGVLVFALAGYIPSLWIPKAGPASPKLAINPNIVGETLRVIGFARQDRRVFLSILGISWFWLVGATFLAQFPAFAKDTLGGDKTVITLFLTLFSVGIGLGSLLCNRLLQGAVSARYVPIGALGMSLAVLALYFTTRNHVPGDGFIDWQAFLALPSNWPIVASLLALAILAGLYIVPLYAIMQHHSEKAVRARVIAANNVLNALFMVVSAIGTLAMLSAGLSVPEVFLWVAIANFLVAIYICKLLPDTVVKPPLRAILRLLYKVEIEGLDNYAKAGARTVIVANHVSFLDGFLLAVFLPDRPTFAINTYTARQWWMGPFLALIDFFPIDPTRPLTTKALIHEVRNGRRIVIFPEGRLTVTGALMKVYEGPGMIADKAGAEILPIRIDGAQYTPLSRLKGKVRLRWFPQITLTVLAPRRFAVADHLRGRQRRQASGRKLYDLMSDMIFETCERHRTLFTALDDAAEVHGLGTAILEDVERRPMTYKTLRRASHLLGRRLAKKTKPGENVALLLPNTNGSVAAFFALQAFGRVPAMLNFTAGLKSMDAACRAAGVMTIVTSRRFVAMSKLEGLLQDLADRRHIVYLEDLKATMGPVDWLYGFFTSGSAVSLHQSRLRRHRQGPQSPAVILFTSGSEGLPKAVVLSHENILANTFQLGARVDFNPTDRVFNALPLFHSFGLSSGTLLPLLSGIRTFLYPSPLHYRIIPELVYDTNSTILFGTDTFLAGYARVAHAYDFYSLRHVFAGAEKVKDHTRRSWSETFGLRILEGYGTTETAPVLATNTPMQFRPGTVGRILPGIETRLEPVPGVTSETGNAGRLLVKGPNVMLGYYRPDRPMKLEPVEDGWYDTGDIVEIDDEGFVTIVGRVKRFAKIAGEMVSLGAVEEQAARLWPGAPLAVVSLPDERKGEQLVLLSEDKTASRETFLGHAQSNGLTELMVPRQVFSDQGIPLLGSGKIDYVAARALAEDLVSGRLPGTTDPTQALA